MRSFIFIVLIRLVLLYVVLSIIASIKGRSEEQLIKIGIIDTGYDFNYAKSINAEPLKLCDKGHYDFLTRTETINHAPAEFSSNIGHHGTLVASIIANKLKKVRYCAIVIQVYETCEEGCSLKKDNLIKAVEKLIQEKVLVINMSYSGITPYSDEQKVMKKAVDRGISLFVAAGNNGENLNRVCQYYPACYLLPNEYVIGATENGKICPVSNTGRIVHYANGTLPKSLKVEDKCATSYAAPTVLSEFVLSFSRLLHGHPKH